MPRRKLSRAQREQRIAEQVWAERDEEAKKNVLRLRSGDKNQMEDDTEKLLAKARKLTPNDELVYLSREQEMLRRSKEVYNSNGIPDASLVSGLYKRVYNPLAGTRPGKQQKSGDD